MGAYRFPTKTKKTYNRKNKHNKTYNGQKTLRTKEVEKSFGKFLIIGTVIVYLFCGTYAFATKTRTITISGGGIVEDVDNSSETVKQATPQEEGCLHPKHPSNEEISVRELTEKEWILYTVKQAGLNPKIAEKIIFCESSFQKEAIGVNRNGSKDVGYWQINDIHNLSVVDRIDYKKATEWAIGERLRRGNWSAWNSSAHCWNN